MRPKDWNRILAALTWAAPVPLVARAETYLSEAQAAAALFPGVRLERTSVELTPEQAKRIAKASGERVRDKRVRVWRGPKGECLFVDEVVGKHEFITYAVAIDADGKIRGIEIMEYRETYGHEVRKPEWRAQFAGKTALDPLKIDKDIRNISGATLSSVHVTNGVRRVLQTYETLKTKA